MSSLTAVMVLCCASLGETNIRSYTLTPVNAGEVSTYDCVLSVLPNGDRVNIPVLNGKVPVLYIHLGKDSDNIVMDYADKSCVAYKGEKLFSFQTLQPGVNGSNILETFSDIRSQIESLKKINNDRLLSSEKKTDEAFVRLKELETMVDKNKKDFFTKTENLGLESKQGINDIKGMVSDLRKELNQIKEKLDSKSRTSDIIDPKLPIVDRALIPSAK